jgi:hypothetical protein
MIIVRGKGGRRRATLASFPRELRCGMWAKTIENQTVRKPTLEEWRTDRENLGSRRLPLTPPRNDYHFHAE